jgi:hypothetical protein
VERKKLSLSEIIFENEMAISGLSKDENQCKVEQFN